MRSVDPAAGKIADDREGKRQAWPCVAERRRGCIEQPATNMIRAMMRMTVICRE